MIVENKIVTFEELEATYSKYISVPSDLENIKKAYEFANKKHMGQFRKSGDPYISHALAVALILAQMQTAPTTLMAGLLHDTIEDTDTTKEEIEANFGQEVAFLVEGLTKITRLSDFHKTDFLAEDHRKIFIAMAQDIRVIVIKLADRLHNMRTLQFQPEEKQKRISKETMDVYVPIAHRLGLNTILSEMQDLSLYYLDKEGYQKIEALLNESTKALNSSLNKIKDKITKLLAATKIPFEISSRVKSIYSIYKKMYIKNKKFEDIYDILALRIITQSETNCYEILGYIHSAFLPVPGRFKDYIAMPKPNMYQSLHTTILSGDGHVFEIQIRTKEMDETAEEGVAAHWRYKEGTKYDPKKEQRDIEDNLHWFKYFVNMSDEEAKKTSASDYVNSLQKDIFQANVYVFTPKGKVIDLPKGSTPIDFAYRIHTQIGENLYGAKVNGKLVPVSTVLKTGDMVEVETKENACPSSSWLNMCATNFAKSKIKKFLAKQNLDYVKFDQIEKAKQSLKDALKERKLNFSQLEKMIDNKCLNNFKCNNIDELYLKIYSKNVTPQALIDYFKLEPDDASVSRAINSSTNANKNKFKAVSDNAILLSDGSTSMIKLANCCTPIPGDEIVGYITKGNGIKVHRQDCPNIQKESSRQIDVIWNPNLSKNVKYPCDVAVECYDRNNLLVDIMNIATSQGASLIKINAKLRQSNKTTLVTMTLQVTSAEQLSKIFDSLKQLNSVYEVRRCIH